MAKSSKPVKNLTTEKIRQLLSTDPDFVYLPRYDYSIAKVVERYPQGAPTGVIASALLMSEEEVEETYETAVKKLRQLMGVTGFDSENEDTSEDASL